MTATTWSATAVDDSVPVAVLTYIARSLADEPDSVVVEAENRAGIGGAPGARRPRGHGPGHRPARPDRPGHPDAGRRGRRP